VRLFPRANDTGGTYTEEFVEVLTSLLLRADPDVMAPSTPPPVKMRRTFDGPPSTEERLRGKRFCEDGKAPEQPGGDYDATTPEQPGGDNDATTPEQPGGDQDATTPNQPRGDEDTMTPEQSGGHSGTVARTSAVVHAPASCTRLVSTPWGAHAMPRIAIGADGPFIWELQKHERDEPEDDGDEDEW
jgi:hypothetical protein